MLFHQRGGIRLSLVHFKKALILSDNPSLQALVTGLIADIHYKQGYRYLAVKEYTEALALLSPHDIAVKAKLLNNRAVAFLAVRGLDAEQDILDEAKQDISDEPKQDALDDAKQDIKEAILLYQVQNNRLISRAYFNYGLILQTDNKFNEALEAYKNALSQGMPDSNAQIHFNRCMTLYQAKNFDAALTAGYTALKRFNPKEKARRVQIYCIFAEIYNEKHNHSHDALNAINKAYRLTSEHDPLVRANIHRIKANIFSKLGNVQKAEECYLFSLKSLLPNDEAQQHINYLIIHPRSEITDKNYHCIDKFISSVVAFGIYKFNETSLKGARYKDAEGYGCVESHAIPSIYTDTLRENGFFSIKSKHNVVEDLASDESDNNMAHTI